MIEDKVNKTIVLFLGFFFVSLMGMTIYRVYIKLLINLEILDSLGEMHSFHFIRTKANKRKWHAIFKVNPIMGKWIPLLSSGSLLIALILILSGFYSF